MIYTRKKRGNIIFITKRRAEICICENFIVYLHRIWKQKLKPIENYESTMDEFGRGGAGTCGSKTLRTENSRKWRMGGCVQ